ncbi:MAG: decaprenyl-phosphate phosphoribosyltransferase [Candidatus Woesearchaeota archaeon]
MPRPEPHRASWPFLRACRPRQWLKNTVVLIAPATAGALSRPRALVALLGAFVAFCLISSATYLINDVRDLESDRHHPRKRLRPVAAGELSVRAALGAAVGLAIAALLVAATIRMTLVLVVIGYLALTLSYTLLWREIVVMDLLLIACGFVFRAVAGGAAVGVSLSSAFLVVTSACALFLIVGKRIGEIATSGRLTRGTLQRYSLRGLRLLLTGSATVGCLAYASWAFGRSGAGPWLALSLLPFGLWLGRYAALVREGAGETPEELVLGDGGLIALSVIWTLLFIAGIYGAG